MNYELKKSPIFKSIIVIEGELIDIKHSPYPSGEEIATCFRHFFCSKKLIADYQGDSC